MKQHVLLITPPFTQFNTPYPATAYLKGFLNAQHISSSQVDLGIEVILSLFSSTGFTALFSDIEKKKRSLTRNAMQMLRNKNAYINTIDWAIGFLQGNNPTLAHVICSRTYLPEASRFAQVDNMAWLLEDFDVQDKATFFVTLFLEDISDLIVDTVDKDFGFSRYAERLGRSASTFDKLEEALQKPAGFIDRLMVQVLKDKIDSCEPSVVAFSIPFPGNVYSAFKCAQWIKKNKPETRIVMGGGYVNTELRSISDPRVFQYTDFISLDDGEAPLMHILEMLGGKRLAHDLKRTFMLHNGEVAYMNGTVSDDVTQQDVGTPDYTGLPLAKYLSVVEVVNPMHRLWSDGRWNKLTLAHGCYWAKCSFCDTSLDYIRRYEANSVQVICDRMEALIKQTGYHGFHFVDEAAPPVLLKELANEIISRKLEVVWWTNIRFEKNFTLDLCQLLKQSGCIAVTGGLEVASDRVLKLINKGVSVEQVANVANNFSKTGIMVHAYLMYGFPTQTVQETIDSLEIVRQLFMHGLVQSAYWHHFALTVHSPVWKHPEHYHIIPEDKPLGSFANNDWLYDDPEGCNHDAFGEGLRKSLYNYMHGQCFDFPLNKWFNFKVPNTTIPPDFIMQTCGLKQD